MPERSQKRKLGSDQSTSQIDEDVANSPNDENTPLSNKDFEDISNKIENKISKRLRDTELNQREILKLIESLSSKVDNVSNVSSERGCLTDRVENSGNSVDELEEVDLARVESSNTVTPSILLEDRSHIFIIVFDRNVSGPFHFFSLFPQHVQCYHGE